MYVYSFLWHIALYWNNGAEFKMKHHGNNITIVFKVKGIAIAVIIREGPWRCETSGLLRFYIIFSHMVLTLSAFCFRHLALSTGKFSCTHFCQRWSLRPIHTTCTYQVNWKKSKLFPPCSIVPQPNMLQRARNLKHSRINETVYHDIATIC